MNALAIGSGAGAPAVQLAGPARGAAHPSRTALERLGYGLVAVLIFLGCFVAPKPAPYEFAAFAAIAVWGLVGLRPHRSVLLLAIVLLFWRVGVLIALLPYVDDPESVTWTSQSIYLAVTALFFAIFFGEDTRRRIHLALRAYGISCVVAALGGVASYFVPGDLLFATYGRAAGFFPDPNVFGSYLILGAIHFAHGLIAGTARRPRLAALALAIVMAGVFLSFSRGSWLAAVVGLGLTSLLTWRISPPAIRRRIVGVAAASVVLTMLGVAGLLSVGTVGERFTDRAQITHDYDEGETGRFGNQLRAIPMLLERPEGFGPLRFYRIFGIDPHNSYIGGFANGGWLGGLGFFGLVIATVLVCVRLCVRPSPYRDLAAVVCPALLMFFLQAFQIDIDPWRHVYLLLGMVWGLEAARQRWEASRPGPG